MAWRKAVAAAIGIADLGAHWRKLEDPTYCPPGRPLMILLDHSDCDGQIESMFCAAIADDLESIIGHLDNNGPFSPRKCAVRWIDGLRAAAKAGENIEFH